MDRLWWLIPAVVLIALIIWGPSKLPEVGAGMGRAIREFRNAMSGRDSSTVDSVPAPAQPVAPMDAMPHADDRQPAIFPDDSSHT